MNIINLENYIFYCRSYIITIRQLYLHLSPILKYLTNTTIVPQSNIRFQIFICHLSSIIFSASYVRTILLLRVEDAPDSRNFHFHLREEKEKLSSTRRDLLTDSITDSLKLRGIFIVGHECKLPVGSGILAVLIIFKRVGGNLNWKFLLSPSPPYDPLDLSSLE